MLMLLMPLRRLLPAVAAALMTLGSCASEAPTAAVALAPLVPVDPPSSAPLTPAGASCTPAQPVWLWCDDFETDRTASYFEYDAAGGAFVRTSGAGVDGSYGMRVRFAAGQVNAGSLKVAFGKVPDRYFRTVDGGTAVFRDIYWRMWVKNQAGWTGGGGDKLSRATSFAASNWSQAMVAHVWSGSGARANYLLVDPASGTDSAGTLRSIGYNDFVRWRWLGQASSVTPMFDAARVGKWHCVEAHARLNDAALSNGVHELWIDGALEAQRTGLNFVGAYSTYGINAVLFENYWNAGSPVAQERYIDGLVVSTQRIGC